MQVGSGRVLQSELNVTPMIDVVLVLLIIFMVVTPKNHKELPVVVPEAASDALPPPPTDDPLVVEVDAHGALRFLDLPVASLDDLRLKVAEAVASRQEKVVFLEAHDDASYDTCIKAMDAARKGGARHVGLVSPPPVPPAPPP